MRAIKSKKLFSIIAILTILSFATSMFTLSDTNAQPVWWYNDQTDDTSKGLSEMTVSVSDAVTTVGSSVRISGTVLDISPGTEREDLRMRFPNGVPVVSDESVSDWMRYVYQHYERSATAKGVEIKIFAYENDEEIPIGTTESDTQGTFTITWAPKKAGEYELYAVFNSTDAYYGSYAATTIEVSESNTSYMWYIIGGGIAIFAVLLAIILLTHKK
jgi:hypothetical protein